MNWLMLPLRIVIWPFTKPAHMVASRASKDVLRALYGQPRNLSVSDLCKRTRRKDVTVLASLKLLQEQELVYGLPSSIRTLDLNKRLFGITRSGVEEVKSWDS